jgi:hypothetical protein
MGEDLPVARELPPHRSLSLSEKLLGGFVVKTKVDFARTLIDAELFDIQFLGKKARNTCFDAVRAGQILFSLHNQAPGGYWPRMNVSSATRADPATAIIYPITVISAAA